MIGRKIFSQVMSAGGIAIALSSGIPFAASARLATAQIRPDSSPTVAQAPADRENTMTIQAGSLVFSQTDSIAVRVYDTGDNPRLNLYNKATRQTEILGEPATVDRTETGVTYRYTGEQTIEIAVDNAGSQTITINGKVQQPSETVSGTVFYLPRIALAPNAMVEVSLLDVSRVDAIATTLASMKMVSGGRQVPLPFELLYDAGQINERNTYAVRSRITVDGDLQFASTTQTPVITNGNPIENVEIQVDPVGQIE